VVWSGRVPVAPDTSTYVAPARNLAVGRGYSDDSGQPYSYRPPTYPLFLATVFRIAGESLAPVQICQAVLAAAGAAGLALWVARRRGPAAGALTGALLSLDPILIPVPAFVLTEALGTLFVASLVICVYEALMTRRPAYGVAAGALGGAAALNTPVTLLLVPWLLGTDWAVGSRRPPHWRSWGLCLGLTAACVGAWTMRNYLVQGNIVLVQDRSFAEWLWRTTEYHFDWIPGANDPAAVQLEQRFQALAAGRTPRERQSLFLRAAWENFRGDPLLVIGRVAKANFWAWMESPGSHLSGRLRPFRWVTLGFHQLQLLGLVIALGWMWHTGRLREWALWVSTILYFFLFVGLLYPIPRYYVPLWPVVDTLVVAGLWMLPWRTDRARVARTAPPPQGHGPESERHGTPRTMKGRRTP
jgi:4-amino-4-deoxy-L-arabinose transferase-like glycosyltransferase